ncbi:MAG: hypothetical protein DUD32_08940 [Lactobacillus sp.]|nr:MAG: hypothetical protein DUD32_08940 [Lactobacillus sp.]
MEVKSMMTNSSGYKSSDQDLLDAHVARHKGEHYWRRFDNSSVPDITVLKTYHDNMLPPSKNAKEMMLRLGFLDDTGVKAHDAQYPYKSQANKRYGNWNGYLFNRTKMIRKGLANNLVGKSDDRRKDASIQINLLKHNNGIPITSTLLYLSNIDVYEYVKKQSANSLNKYRQAERESFIRYFNSNEYRSLHKNVLVAEIDSDEQGTQHLQSSELHVGKDRYGNRTFDTTQVKQNLVQKYLYGEDAVTSDGKLLPQYESDWNNRWDNYKTDKGRSIKGSYINKSGHRVLTNKTTIVKGMYHDLELNALEKYTVQVMNEHGFDYKRIKGHSDGVQRTPEQYKRDKQNERNYKKRMKELDHEAQQVKCDERKNNEQKWILEKGQKDFQANKKEVKDELIEFVVKLQPTEHKDGKHTSNALQANGEKIKYLKSQSFSWITDTALTIFRNARKLLEKEKMEWQLKKQHDQQVLDDQHKTNELKQQQLTNREDELKQRELRLQQREDKFHRTEKLTRQELSSASEKAKNIFQGDFEPNRDTSKNLSIGESVKLFTQSVVNAFMKRSNRLDHRENTIDRKQHFYDAYKNEVIDTMNAKIGHRLYKYDFQTYSKIYSGIVDEYRYDNVNNSSKNQKDFDDEFEI